MVPGSQMQSAGIAVRAVPSPGACGVLICAVVDVLEVEIVSMVVVVVPVALKVAVDGLKEQVIPAGRFMQLNVAVPV